ncbi:GMP/IMP nucleotidase [Cedecea neteri]|uniref:GMP/IMP nucleotidase n=1 Tax=Cedecea neteri TaxID=158822 RepID=A0A2X2T3Q9_9ENTR|nr:GMP/IMP nucleotidase [Cedecea neteri]
MSGAIAWQDVDTLLLDMDGPCWTLAFDNHFWKKLVPETISLQRGIPLQEAHQLISREYHAVQHTLNWYCLDYWSERLRAGYLCHDHRAGAKSRAT